MLHQITFCLIAGVLLTLKLLVVATPFAITLYAIWRVYRAKGGKKDFFAYTDMVSENLLDWFNELIERLFKW